MITKRSLREKGELVGPGVEEKDIRGNRVEAPDEGLVSNEVRLSHPNYFIIHESKKFLIN